MKFLLKNIKFRNQGTFNAPWFFFGFSLVFLWFFFGFSLFCDKKERPWMLLFRQERASLDVAFSTRKSVPECCFFDKKERPWMLLF